MEKQKILYQQARLHARGAAEMVLQMISASKGNNDLLLPCCFARSDRLVIDFYLPVQTDTEVLLGPELHKRHFTIFYISQYVDGLNIVLSSKMETLLYNTCHFCEVQWHHDTDSLFSITEASDLRQRSIIL